MQESLDQAVDRIVARKASRRATLKAIADAIRARGREPGEREVALILEAAAGGDCIQVALGGRDQVMVEGECQVVSNSTFPRRPLPGAERQPDCRR